MCSSCTFSRAGRKGSGTDSKHLSTDVVQKLSFIAVCILVGTSRFIFIYCLCYEGSFCQGKGTQREHNMGIASVTNVNTKGSFHTSFSNQSSFESNSIYKQIPVVLPLSCSAAWYCWTG